MAGRNRYRLPLSPGLRAKFDALERVFDLHVIGTAYAGSPLRDDVFQLVPPQRPVFLDGALFYLRMPRRVAAELRAFGPEAILTQSPYEAAAVLAGRRLARSDARLIVDVHGDWRTLSRLYGSPLRALGRPFFDAIAAFALRRADGVRTVSGYTTQLVRELGVEPSAEFTAYMELEPFTARPVVPLPERPRALFVGVLERYKAFDVLAESWREVVRRLPEAVLHVVGQGTLAPVAEQLVAELPENVLWTPSLAAEEVATALDDATLLVLPSRSEGLGRVVIEAGCRARGVVGSRVGGIPNVVHEDRTGILVPPGDASALADALVRVLSDRGLAERLGAEGRASVQPWLATADDFAERVRDLVEEIVGSR